MTIPVARSLRILGACIHVAIVSPCTLHRCTIRKMPSKVPLCDACTPNLLLKIEQQHMTPQDKSTLNRSQIVPAMLYAPYSCTPTQTWIKSTLSLLYQAITKKSYGGYKSYYALRLAQGGLQFTDPKTLIAHHTANLLNRELVPCSVQTRATLAILASLTRNHRTNWPIAIQTALGHELTLHLHAKVISAYQEQSSQNERSTAQANIAISYSRKTTTAMASTTYNSNTTLDTPLTATHTHPCETQALATVVAQTILYLQQHHHKVTVSHNSSKLTKAYEQYLELPIRRRVHHPNHGALFVLSQPTIDIIEDPDVSPNQSSATATICNALTLTWPIYAQIAQNRPKKNSHASGANIHSSRSTWTSTVRPKNNGQKIRNAKISEFLTKVLYFRLSKLFNYLII